MNTEIDVPPTDKINIQILATEIKTKLGLEIGVTRLEEPRSAIIIHADRELTETEIQEALRDHVYVDPPTPVKPKTSKEEYALLTTDAERIEFIAKESGLK